MKTSTPLSLNVREIVFLAGVIGSDGLVGIPDPFEGWLASEVEEALWQVRRDLIDRGLCTVQADDSLSIANEIAPLVATIASPTASFTVTYASAPGTHAIRHVHVTGESAVEHTVIDGESPRCEFTSYNGPDAISRRVLELLKLPPGPVTVPTCPGGRLRQAALMHARQTATSDRAAAATLLRQNGLEVATATALAEALATAGSNSSLIAINRQTAPWTVDGLGLLEGGGALWLLRGFTRNGEEWAEATPSDVERAERVVLSLLHQSLSGG